MLGLWSRASSTSLCRVYVSFPSSLYPVLTPSCQAFDLYLDSGSVPEERIVSLSRLLVGSIVVRGAQLAIIKRLPTDDHVRIHTDAAVYIVAKLSSFESTKRKESRNKALSFFKALSNLLIGIDGKGALKM